MLPEPSDVLLDKYELEWELGRGGYGVVFKGKTLSTGRPVAVKILKPSRQAESPQTVKRFKREMAAVAQLQCPHTMTLYDFGRTEAGALFMVCEYVEGTDLIDLIVRRGSLKPSRVLDILRQVLLSLSEAHELGILHRDIKPANIRIQFPPRGRLRAKLLDFGLAVRLDSDDARLTGTGLVVGTPRYMSPEQIRGIPLGPPTDIYSLGVVMIEALLGRGSVRVGQVVELPEDAGVNRALRDVLNRMVAPNLKERYQTAAEVLADLPRRHLPEPETIPRHVVSDEEAARELTEEKTTTAFRSLREPGQAGRWPLLLLGVLVLAAAGLGWIALAERGADAPQVRTRVVPPPSPAKLTAPAVAQEVPPRDPIGCANMPALGAGVHELVVRRGLREDRVWVHLPAGYDRTTRHRVILMFPDLERTGEDTMRMVAAQPHNPELEPFVVISGAPAGELWLTARDQMHRGWDRVAALSRELCIDDSSVFLLGHGAGGAPVLRTMCKFPILGAATIGFRIRTNDEVCRNPKVPLLNIEVDDNPYAPIEGGLPCTVAVDVRSLESQDYVLRRKFGCSSDIDEIQREDGSTCFTTSCDVPFESCVVKGGRDWAGMPPLKSKCRSVPGTYSFRDRIWQFFSDAQPRSGEPSAGDGTPTE